MNSLFDMERVLRLGEVIFPVKLPCCCLHTVRRFVNNFEPDYAVTYVVERIHPDL